MRHAWAAALIVALTLPASARADTYGDRIASEVARTNVVLNYGGDPPSDSLAATPPVYEEWSTGCGLTRINRQDWQNGTATADLIQQRFSAVPLPCYFQASTGPDHEAVLLWHGPRPAGTFQNYETWVTWWDGVWRAYWGGGADDIEFAKDAFGVWTWPNGMGVQASGIKFDIPRVTEFQAGAINRPVQLEVPEACGYQVAPAVRTDGWGSMATNPHCVPYGTEMKLNPSFDPSGLSGTAQTLVRAMQRYGAVVTDQTHDTVAIRLENWRRPWASWGDQDPYMAVFSRGLDRDCMTNWAWACYPDKNNLLSGIPWAQLYRAN